MKNSKDSVASTCTLIRLSTFILVQTDKIKSLIDEISSYKSRIVSLECENSYLYKTLAARPGSKTRVTMIGQDVVITCKLVNMLLLCTDWTINDVIIIYCLVKRLPSQWLDTVLLLCTDWTINDVVIKLLWLVKRSWQDVVIMQWCCHFAVNEKDFFYTLICQDAIDFQLQNLFWFSLALDYITHCFSNCDQLLLHIYFWVTVLVVWKMK